MRKFGASLHKHEKIRQRDALRYTDTQNMRNVARLIPSFFNSIQNRAFSGTLHQSIKVPRANKMPPRPKIIEEEISEKFIKGGSGKGGQKINKTNSKVQLTHLPTGLVVTSQATRSREQNRKIARDIMALKLQDSANPETSRLRIVNEREKLVKDRKRRRSKAKYQLLEDGKGESKDHLSEEELELLKGIIDFPTDKKT